MLPRGCRPIHNTDRDCAVIPGYCARADGLVLRRRKSGEWVPLASWRHTAGGLRSCRVKLPDGRLRDLSLGRLICRAFHGPRPIGCDVFWFPDADRANCRADNLRWAPKGASKLGMPAPFRARHHAGEHNPGAVLTESVVLRMRRQYRLGRTSAAIAARYDISETAARRAISGSTWRHVPGAVKMRRTGAPVGNLNRLGRVK
jgi:HNH endonuclease